MLDRSLQLRRPLQLLHCQAPGNLLENPQALVPVFRFDSESLLASGDLCIGVDDKGSRVPSIRVLEGRMTV